MFHEYMVEEEFGDLGGSDLVGCWNGNKLFTCLVDHVEDCGMSVGRWEVFNEVEGVRVPRTGWNWELLNEPKGFVSWGLVLLARNTGVDIVLDVCPDVRPGVLPTD